EEQKEEEKLPGADEAGPGAVDRGFTDNADWAGESGTAPGIEGAPQADATWNDPGTGGDWAQEATATAAAAAPAPAAGW
ncbi:hypothetical protein ABEF95_000039, partial [Exophiala dermatitidis]